MIKTLMNESNYGQTKYKFCCRVEYLVNSENLQLKCNRHCSVICGPTFSYKMMHCFCIKEAAI